MSTEKRIILITGANKGIGFDTSYALVAASAQNHVLLSARSASKGEKAVKDIQARNPIGTVGFLQLDVTNDESVAAAAKKIASNFGRLDVLVNNAGIILKGPTTRELLHTTFDTNVFGPLLLTEALASSLEKSKDPRIINITSELGSITQRADPSSPYYATEFEPYRMSKSALNMLATCFAHNFKDWRVPAKVWALCPGFVITDLTGADQREWRKEHGADSSETSAQAVVELVEGKRDAEANHFVTRFGKQSQW